MTDASKEPYFSPDPVIEVYKKDVDRTILRRNLRLSRRERFERFERFMRGIGEIKNAVELKRAKREERES